MITFTVNNREIQTDNCDVRLIDYLRDELRLTSVKEGCSEGACGTCMVLVDGEAKRACIYKLGSVDGKKILTAEGLSQKEKEIYSRCFAEAGAVQCGFCTPGMVISAKALLDKNPRPTREEVKKAINQNICRCTGYVKIIDAIIMVSEALESECATKRTSAKLGENLPRIDAESKTLGTAKYTDDLTLDGMLYAKVLRTKYPRARILSIDTSRAEAHPKCIRIITAKDIPGNIKCGHLKKDWDALIQTGSETRYIGDAIAIAVTTGKDCLDEVTALIDVKYEALKPVTSPQEALENNAPKIHVEGNILFEQILKRGDAKTAIENAAYAVTNKFSLPFTEHAFMEPECAVAAYDGDGGIIVYTGGQSIFDEQREISSLLGISKDKIRVKSMMVGGAFGGKEDMSVQHYAALCAWLIKKPVKIKLSRQESINTHPKRHAMEIDITAACDKDGIITAVKAEIIADTGAYASLGAPVLQRACTHLGGPYNYQNVDICGKAVYTNNPPAGAFRGFGVAQACFAMESCINQLAEKAGISPWDIRYKNAVRAGQVLPNGQIADENTSLAECLIAVKDIYSKTGYAGIACGFKNSGLGVGINDAGRCIISIENGKVHIRSSAACVGQGVATVLKQMVCETLEVSEDIIIIEPPDTARTPDSGTTTASRQTLFTGQAAVMAAREMLKDIERGEQLSEAIERLEGREYYGEYAPQTDAMNIGKEYPASHVTYSYAAQVAELDETNKVRKITAAYDIGTVVNPVAAEGQVEGGVLMGIGYAQTEDFPLKECMPAVKYGTLGLIRAKDAPEIETIFISKEKQSELPAYGAKGVGELAAIPTAPAIAGALFKKDGILRIKLPMKE